MNSSKVIQRAAIAIASLAAVAAWGHPNHAEPGASATLLHLVTEPDHLLAIAAAVGAVIWAVRRARASGKRRGD